MQNRRDQAQAQSYLLGRVTGALVAGEPDGLETPHRRTLTGLGIGTLIAVLIAAGFAVYGLVVPGGATAWRTSGALIVEKETGTRYLYLDGRLRPVLNYASARLLLGTDIALVTVSATSLAGTPHGTPVGIAGAPDGLPTRGLAGAWWTVCATGGTLAVTGKPAGPAAGADEAIVARAAGAVFLVLNGRRHRLGNDWIVRVLGFSGAEVTVPAAWLDLVPAGADLAPVEVPGRGGRGPEVDGAPSRIGQLFTSDRGGYVLTRSGLSPLTPLAYTLLAADPRTARLYTGGVVAAVALSPAALARLPVVTTLVPEGQPATAPHPAGQASCLRIAPGGAVSLAAGTAGTGTVSVEAGLGGLVVAGRAGADPGTAYSLITDAGIRYPVENAEVAGLLGYPVQAAAVVPPGVLDLIPAGPALALDRIKG